MSVFTKDDLKRLYESEINLQQNKCIQLIVQHMKQLVINEAKEGRTTATYKHSDDYCNDEWVKTQILSDLERIFTDSVIQITSDSSVFPTIAISIDWA
jgi:hypothetical protein